jgi:hypothetical protein
VYRCVYLWLVSLLCVYLWIGLWVLHFFFVVVVLQIDFLQFYLNNNNNNKFLKKLVTGPGTHQNQPVIGTSINRGPSSQFRSPILTKNQETELS